MPYQGGPLTDEVMIFSPLVEGTFPLFNVVQLQLAPEMRRNQWLHRVSPQSRACPGWVRWVLGTQGHSSPLEIASSLCWVLGILPELLRSICHLFFVSSLKQCQLLLTTEIQLQRQALGTALAGSSGLQLFLWWLKFVLITLSMGRTFPSVLWEGTGGACQTVKVFQIPVHWPLQTFSWVILTPGLALPCSYTLCILFIVPVYVLFRFLVWINVPFYP